MNKRVSLVFPRIVSGWQAHPRMAIPMNLLCMATQVDREGYQVQFIDQRTEPNWRLIMTKELEQTPVCVAISAKTGTQLFDLAAKYGLSVPKKMEDWIPFNYRNYKKNSPWLSKEMRNFMEMLDFRTSFIGKSNFLQPYEKTNPLLTFISNLYAPLAMKRVQKSVYQFPVEVKLAKLLKFYAKQN